MKTESVAEFVARGGKIKKLAAKGPKKSRPKVFKEAKMEEVDMSVLPAALKIRFGVR